MTHAAAGRVALAAMIVPLFALSCAPAAWASYGQMKFEGLSFFFAVTFLFGWGVLLVMGLGLGGARYKAFAVVATVVTVLLTALLIAFFHDGRSTMQQRPPGMGAAFVVLLLAAVPVMLAAPILQRAAHLRGTTSRLSMAVLVVAVLLPPAGSVLVYLLQDHLADRAVAQARALTPGRLLPHVVASRQRAASSWLSPYLWSEAAETKWIVVGLGRLGFVESPVPLSDEDTRALELLVESSAGTRNANYTWKLAGKLAWDRLMRAAPGERVAVASRLSRAQAQQLYEFIGAPHTDWLCAPLADPDTAKAFDQVWTLLSDHGKDAFSAAVREKCGRQIGAAAR